MNVITEGYIFGTKDKERECIQMQHDAWKSELETLLSLSDFRSGQTLIDLISGPGYMSVAQPPGAVRLQYCKRSSLAYIYM